jgi:hypothetical protein
VGIVLQWVPLRSSCTTYGGSMRVPVNCTAILTKFRSPCGVNSGGVDGGDLNGGGVVLVVTCGRCGVISHHSRAQPSSAQSDLPYWSE